MPDIFADFDFSTFWDKEDDTYLSEPATETLILELEAELGYKLPRSYIEFMRHQNGGTPQMNGFAITIPTTGDEVQVPVTGFYGIGRENIYSLCGQFGSRFMMEEWGYPDIGVYFGDCPSGGHDFICLDYRKNGPEGEPEVVHVDQESDFEITLLAPDFETFVRGLLPMDEYLAEE